MFRPASPFSGVSCFDVTHSEGRPSDGRWVEDVLLIACAAENLLRERLAQARR